MPGAEANSYIPEQAHEEANKIQSFVGGKGSSQDYETAHGMVVEEQTKKEFEKLDWLGALDKGSAQLAGLYDAAANKSNRVRGFGSLKGRGEESLRERIKLKGERDLVEAEKERAADSAAAGFKPSAKVWFTQSSNEVVFLNSGALLKKLSANYASASAERFGQDVYDKLREARSKSKTLTLDVYEQAVFKAGLEVVLDRLDDRVKEMDILVEKMPPQIDQANVLARAASQNFDEAEIKYRVAVEEFTAKEKAMGAPVLSKNPTAAEVKELIEWRRVQMRKEMEVDEKLRGKLWPHVANYDKWALFWLPEDDKDAVLLNPHGIANYVYADDLMLATALPGRVVALYSESLSLDARRVTVQGDFRDGMPKFTDYRENEATSRQLVASGQNGLMQRALRGL